MVGRVIRDKKGQIADIIMFLFFFSFVVYFIVAFASSKAYFMTQDVVKNIVESKVQLVTTKGRLTKLEYEDMLTRIGKYGRFNVYVTIDKLDETGRHYSLYNPQSFLDEPLGVGDFIKVYVESIDRPLFSEILSRGFTFGYSKHKSNFRIQVLSSGMICVDGHIRGLEVIEAISRYKNEPSITKLDVHLFDYPYDPTLGIPPSYSTYDYLTLPNYDIDTTPYTNGWINPEGRYKIDITRDVTATGNDYGRIKEVEIRQLIANLTQ